MESLHQILSPDFLLRNSLYTSLLVGLACPLVGIFLVMRRLAFMGVALPQISSTGIAFALSCPVWLGFNPASFSPQTVHMQAFAGSVVFSLVAILTLAFMERRGRGQLEGRLGTAYVVAGALSILLLAQNPSAEIGLLDMLKGEVIAVSNVDLLMTAALLALVLVVLSLFQKELLLVSFDRDMASVLRKKIVLWDVLLYILIGLTVSMAVLSVGPLISFGFLLIPALIAHLFSGNMRQFTVISSLIGGAAAFTGFYVAYRWDMPVGPTDVVLLGILYTSSWVLLRLIQAARSLSARLSNS